MSTQTRSAGSLSRREIVWGLVGCLTVVVIGYVGGRWIIYVLGTPSGGPETPLSVALGVLFVAFFVFAAVVELRLRRLAGSTDSASDSASRRLRKAAVVFALTALFAASVVFTVLVVAAATPP